jgi:hypothetical protein
MSLIKPFITVICCITFCFDAISQSSTAETQLASIKNIGYQQSKAMEMLYELTDVYGQRLTGSRGYLAAAKWAAEKMKGVGLDNVHFENYCRDCRGWDMKTFNVEMLAPNYMHIMAFPYAMTKSTNGTVEGEVLQIESFADMKKLGEKFSGKLKGKIILLGAAPAPRSLQDTLLKRFDDNGLKNMEQQLIPLNKQTPLPALLEEWKVDDVSDKAFLEFAEREGALAVLRTRPTLAGILNVAGTYYYHENDLKPLPYFAIMPEHFGRIARLLKQNQAPRIRLNLETSFYMEPENNVNIIGEIKGTDPALKSEVVLVGGHFDSWHTATGATDNAANCIAFMEALRILKEAGFNPKRTIRIGLWGGEEQAFIGSINYAITHYGQLDKKPTPESERVSAYLNLDNGAGLIRGVYLQGNEFARPVFKQVFSPFDLQQKHSLTIENTLSTDHETFDHYNIPSFQFIQDPLSYNTMNHHTHLDLPEYVPENDLKQNAVILAWTIYTIANMDNKMPRKARAVVKQ